jgi:hypothetical protein
MIGEYNKTFFFLNKNMQNLDHKRDFGQVFVSTIHLQFYTMPIARRLGIFGTLTRV